MVARFFIRRDFCDITPHLEAIRTQADSEREALGFLPEPAYAEAARQRKLILLLCEEGDRSIYAGHLLFGGIFPNLRVRQVSIAPKFRRHGHATNLLRTLISQGEKEGYLSIVANVATDLVGSNLFYEKHDFVTSRLKAGGTTRNRKINVRIRQLATPSLISLMLGPLQSKVIDIQPKKRPPDAPIYAIDLNVFFDAIRSRERSEDAGIVFEAAFRHQIRLATSQEFLAELKRTSNDPTNDPVLALARRIPILPAQDGQTLDRLKTSITKIVFPERSSRDTLTKNDVSDVLHLAHAIAAGSSGYVTSDSKILNARDYLLSEHNLDVIGLSEFVDLLELPEIDSVAPTRRTNYFQTRKSTPEEISAFISRENIRTAPFFESRDLSSYRSLSISDGDGLVGISIISPSSAIDRPSRTIVCVTQDHPFASTVADYLISELCNQLSANGPSLIEMMDIASHPITRRIALGQGFQRTNSQTTLMKIAFGQPITSSSWTEARVALERLSDVKLQQACPTYESSNIDIISPQGTPARISPFELETLLSPNLLALSKRKAVIVPITRSYAADLLGTDEQYSLLHVAEANFLSRRTYFNTTRAARAMIRGAVIAFYENGKHGGRGAVVALGRIVDVTIVPVGNVPEALQRGAVVEDARTLTNSKKVLATTFDNLIALRKPVKFKKLREIGCDTRTNFVSATPISSFHLKAIVDAGCKQ